jgi:16S rRNA (uracil1498-N3)-methyltransferase
MTLRDEVARYVAGVHRVGPGERILLFDPNVAREGIAEVVAVRKGVVVCRLDAVRAAQSTPRRRVTLIQAIGKGDKIDAVVRDATELGATAVVAVESERGVVRLGPKGPARVARWRRVAVEAARQCGRGDAPEITGPLSWHAAVGVWTGRPSVRLCFYEGASDPAGPHLNELGPDDEVVLAVGPEGGLAASEVEAARDAGFSVVSLGELVLRTETVAAAVLGGVRIVDQILASRNG